MKRTDPHHFWGVIGLTAAAAAVAAVFLLGGGGGGKVVKLRVDEAASILKGQPVQAGGADVGEVSGVRTLDGGRSAEIELTISDDDVWPLPRDSTFELRWGGTVSFFNRRIVVVPGSKRGPVLEENTIVPAENVVAPEELDTIAGTFDEETRGDFRSLINRSGPAFRAARPGLRAALPVTPPALDEGGDLLADLTADRRALDTMIRSTSRVVDAVQRADPSFGRLLEGAAGTFDAVADEEDDLRLMLERLPVALEQVQRTAERADTTLVAAGQLTDRLGPGIDQLRAVAPPLNGVLTSLVGVAPDVLSTLEEVRVSGPRVNTLLTSVTDTSPRLQSLLAQTDTELGCVRPYAPELAGLMMTWGDFHSYDDGKDKFLRAQVQNFLPATNNSVPFSPQEAKEQFPDLRYGFPRPPGYLAGQPWYLPQCGAGRDAVDPSKDQEALVYANRQAETSP